MSAGVERRRRAARLLYAGALGLAGVAVLVPATPTPAEASEGVTATVTATRMFLDADGGQSEETSAEVRLQVSQTTDLRGRQEIAVSWSGALPTGAVVADPNSADGANQEYPFVLLQCRGVDAEDVPRGQDRLTPETCWTQTSSERYVAAGSATPAWRFDAHASAEGRQAVVGAPDPLPDGCKRVSQPQSAHWLPFRAAGGEVYYGGPDPGVGCTPLAPESDSAEGGGLPSNTTYGVTGADGRGAADFAVWTKAENASLGCSAQVSCALVAVPIVGVSCDAWGTRLPADAPQTTKAGVPLTEQQRATADSTCRRTGSYAAGEPVTGRSTDQAVRGNLWWSESNWRNRITVPLQFAPTAEACDAVSAEKPVELMGSVVLNELTASWRPVFCTDQSLFTFTHVQQADELARSLVEKGEINGAFGSAPKTGGYQRPVVQAPVAFGGFAIAFAIDDAEGRRREDLRLNARLVAKLLTASYPAASFVRNGHGGLGDNPYNITADPEFQALNPGLPESTTLEAAAAMQIFSSSSDLIWALTRWLDADREARAWLDGTADPWGTRVNSAYEGIDLPVDNWPLLDEFLAPQWYIDQNPCYRNSPTPYLQLVANPPSSLNAINLNLQFASSQVLTACRYDGYDQTTLPLRAQGRQTVGHRFVIGLVSLSAARRYNLRVASLQTSSDVPAGQRFGDAGGRTFVTADTAGLTRAAGLLTADPDAGTWAVDAARLSSAADKDAYPGALPVYAVFPTSGLDAPVATKLARFLCYAGGAGQRPGNANGALPAGYLPLTDDNGFTAQRAYLANAIDAVRAQEGAVPGLTDSAEGLDRACDFSAPAGAGEKKQKDEKQAAPAEPPVAAPALPVVALVAEPVPEAAPEAVEAPAADLALALTSGEESALGRIGFPGLILVALLCAVAGTVLRWLEALAAAGSALKAGLRRGRAT